MQEAARRREEEERRARERAEEEEARCLERILEAEPIDSTELHAFTDTMLPGCFHLLDELPDTVYRLCDLLMTAIKRSGPEYRDLILRQVVNQVGDLQQRRIHDLVFDAGEMEQGHGQNVHLFPAAALTTVNCFNCKCSHAENKCLPMVNAGSSDLFGILPHKKYYFKAWKLSYSVKSLCVCLTGVGGC